METKQEWTEYLQTASSLDELRDRLNEMDEWGKPTSGMADDDFKADVAGNVDTSNLPVFGGEEPTETEGIYSWDTDHFLIPGSNYGEPWQIVSR